ncbi:uncharacterized protein LOC114359184 [Ostrinia furnacalis]|uniref:uncharacterized protein LOC114359184 n=1 Tax=Ostrinia furnacalis TaxID=93504 RepID=UPI00103C2AEA|nr:uncharacterized protein LOC114359184 [Ostrinia furnacalis]
MVNESAPILKELIDTTNDCMSTLLNIGVNVGSWDVIVVHILSQKLDTETKRSWEFYVNSHSSADQLPTYSMFQEFLTNRYRAIEFLVSGSNTPRKNVTQNSNKLKALHVNNHSCVLCKEAHTLAFCPGFAKETVDRRRDFVQDNNICFNCLGRSHPAKYCRIKTRCQICKRKHHSLLHSNGKFISEASEDKEQGSSAVVSCTLTEEAGGAEGNITSCFSADKTGKQVLLATAVVNIEANNGTRRTVRALLDQGSQASFVTEATIQGLGLKKTKTKNVVSGLGGDKKVIINSTVNINLQSRVNPKIKFKVKAYVLRKITACLPAKKVSDLEGLDLTGITLADPEYHTPNKVDLLLGADVYGQILQEGLRKSIQGGVIAQSTALGWIISGTVMDSQQKPKSIVVMHSLIDENDLLKKFWELEAEPEIKREKMFTEEEKRCEEIFTKTTSRDEEGRYVVRLPLKNDPPCVDNSREISERRFLSLERKFMKNEALREKYSEVMQEYIDLNHMELVPDDQVDNPLAIYLPHHAVIREDRETTKVRVVYDASCKGKNNMSLNDNLLVGPTLQSELRHLVRRWRTYPVCLTSDIAKMYRQMKISESDVDFQRILWRDNPETKIKHYRMLRVTFGTASAPYLAVKTLQQVAIDEGGSYPMAAERVFRDFYMDDLLTGCQTKEEGFQIFKEMNELLEKGGFELMK